MTEEHNLAFINYNPYSLVYNTRKKLKVKLDTELENIIWRNSEIIISERSEEADESLTTLNKDSVLNPQSNVACHHEERVFSIDHLLELIFSLLDRSSLWSCRLVCSSWAFFGSKELQKRVTIKFTDPVWVPGDKNNSTKNTDASRSRQASIRRLASVMRSSNEFPCSSFQFDITEENQRFVESFLHEHGPSVKTLNLHARFTLRYLWKILFLQLRNLEHFSLTTQEGSDTEQLVVRALARKFNSGEFGKYLVRSLNNNTYSAAGTGGASIVQTFGEQDSLDQYSLNCLNQHIKYPLKLKTVKIHDFYNTPFFENVLLIILKHSPNLTQVQIPSWVYPSLFPPNVNRIRLLRNLEVGLNNKSVDLLQSLALAIHNEGSLSLIKELSFAESPSELMDGESDLVNFPEVWSKVGKLISGILKDVSDSCEKLILPQMGYLKHIVFPVMPKIKELKLNQGPIYPHYYHSSQFLSSEDGRDFRFTTTFPNVKMVSISCSILLPSRMSDLLGNLEQIAIWSVKEVSLEGMLVSTVTRQMINHTQGELQQIFQNAFICDRTMVSGKNLRFPRSHCLLLCKMTDYYQCEPCIYSRNNY